MEKLKFFQDSAPALPAHPTEHGRYRFGPFELNINKHQLLRDGTLIRLQPKCFELLSLFLQNRDRLITKEHLMQALWPDTFVEEANLANLIAALRKALGDSPTQSRFIQTVPKRGYRFTAELAEPTQLSPGPVAQPTTPIRLIVFPFRGDDPSALNHAFADDIASALAELNTFVVRSVQLATSFDPLHWNPKDVAERADVEFIVSGRLRIVDDSVHVVVQVIEAQTGTIRISRSWDLARCDMAVLRASVVQIVVQPLVRSRNADGIHAAPSATPISGEAYKTFLMGNQLSATRTVENMTLARDLYIECVEKAPDFAPAWARLGRCYHFLRKFSANGSEQTKATEKAFERAFSLDPNLVLAHALYTPIQADAGEALSAMLRLSRALKSHPNSPELLAGLVHACRYCGQHDASIQAHNRAMELDPHAHTSVAHTFFALGDYERALFWYGTSAGLYLDALALASQGRDAESLALLSTRRHKFDLMGGAMHALDDYLRGNRKAGLAVLREALASSRYEPELQFYMARQASRFNDPDLANAFLAKSLSGGYWSSITLQRDPWFAAIRPTPEFDRILTEMKTREENARLALMRD